jgi:excisionase family DNA binding protein
MKDQKSLTSRMLTREQTAVYLNIPTNTLYKMVSRREIPYVKHNANLYFDKDLLDQWLKEKTTMPMY